MAERKPLFIQPAGYEEEMDPSDTATFGGLTLGGDIEMQTNLITGLGTPINPQDAVNKQYVDSVTARPIVVVPFTFSTGTLILGMITAGTLLTISQIQILADFAPGSTVSFGTSTSPSAFLSLGLSDTVRVGAYAMDEIITAGVTDFLLLTVVTTGSIGSGRLFYEVQS
jgi:hypothetical protein